MPQLSASPDLISFLQALPERRKRRGVRYLQWLLLLMAILGILSGWRSARDLELTKTPCDSTFLYLFERVELEELFGLLREWMLAQIADQNKDFDQLLSSMAPMEPRDLSPRSRSTHVSLAWRSRRPSLTPENPTSAQP